MNIQIGKYIAKQSTANPNRFDLVKIVTKKSAKLGEYQGESEEGYGMMLETIVQKIIMSNLAEQTETIGLNEFIVKYKKERDTVMNILG
jgi:hypothetical protein